MLSAFMQRAAIVGLFATLRNSMVDTTAYAKLQQANRQQSDPHIPFTLNGRIAEWRTYLGYGLTWSVNFKDTSLEGWYCSFSPEGVVKGLRLIPADKSRGLGRSEFHLDDDEFVRRFEALQAAAVAYVRYYGFSVDQQNRALVGGLKAP